MWTLASCSDIHKGCTIIILVIDAMMLHMSAWRESFFLFVCFFQSGLFERWKIFHPATQIWLIQVTPHISFPTLPSTGELNKLQQSCTKFHHSNLSMYCLICLSVSVFGLILSKVECTKEFLTVWFHTECQQKSNNHFRVMSCILMWNIHHNCFDLLMLMIMYSWCRRMLNML